MAFPTVESVTTSSGEANTSFDFSLPATINNGDLLVLIQANDDVDENPSVTGWTQLNNQNLSINVFLRKADGAEGATATLNLDTTEDVACIVLRITGWSGTLADIESAFAAGDGDTTLDPANLTPSHGSDDYLWIIGMGIQADRTVSSYPTNYTSNQTEIASGSGANGATAACATRNLTASSENPGNWTFDGNIGSNAGAYTIAIRPEQVASGTIVPQIIHLRRMMGAG